MEKTSSFHFWVNYAAFIENENEVLKKNIFAIYGLMTISYTWSKNDLGIL